MKTDDPKDLDKTMGQASLEKIAPQRREAVAKPEIKPGKSQRAINIRLPGGYGMIFDEFDDAPPSEQDISLDLVDEIKDRERAIPAGFLTINFRLTGETRDKSHEALISYRLKDYFVSQYEEHAAKFRRTRRLGIFLIIAGLIADVLVANAFCSIFSEGFLSQIPARIFTLFGYGGFFFGIERVILAYGEQDDLRFFKRMSEAKVIFKDIEVKPTKERAKEPDFLI